MEHQQYNANIAHYSKFQTCLSSSIYFLEQRNYEECIIYAFKANEIDPNHIAPQQILAISNVLMFSSTVNEDPNYYYILNLPLFTQDQQLINTNFKNVSKLVNPIDNRYRFALEAYKVVLRALSVLSDPTQKTRFDNGLKKKEKGGNFGGGSTFWTMCPYCYYVYEFLKDYEDCCLRCQNEKCRRAFHGVQIVGPPPPPDVAEKGEYSCFGFSVLGTEGGKSLWSPFVMKKKKKKKKKNDVNEIIEISDDDEEEDGNGEKEKYLGVEKEFVEANGGEVDKGCINMEGNFKKRRIGTTDDETEDGNGRKEKSFGVEKEFVEADGGEVDKGFINMEGNFKKRRIETSNDDEVEDGTGRKETSLGVEEEFVKLDGGEVDKGCRIETCDDEEEDGNGRKEKSLGVEEGIVKANGGEVDKGCMNMGGNFKKKKKIKMMAKALNKVLGKGVKVNMNEIVYSDGENFEVEETDDLDLGNVEEKNKEKNVEGNNEFDLVNVGEKAIEKNVEENNVFDLGDVGEKAKENIVEGNNEFDLGDVGEMAKENIVEFSAWYDEGFYMGIENDFVMDNEDINRMVPDDFDIGPLFV